ncbi:MAG: hypothetical protein ACRCZJ_05555 [Erysipelotrichaceae bacterium]
MMELKTKGLVFHYLILFLYLPYLLLAGVSDLVEVTNDILVFGFYFLDALLFGINLIKVVLIGFIVFGVLKKHRIGYLAIITLFAYNVFTGLVTIGLCLYYGLNTFMVLISLSFHLALLLIVYFYYKQRKQQLFAY